MKKKELYPEVWYSKKNTKLSCKEKILILNKNIEELYHLSCEVYDEALLMGVDNKQIKEVLKNIVNNLESTLKNVD